MRIRCRLLIYRTSFAVVIFSLSLFVWNKNQTYPIRQHGRNTVRELYKESRQNECLIIDHEDTVRFFSIQNAQHACSNVKIYSQSFIYLQNVTINPHKARNKKGGESLSNVMGQPLNKEDLQLQYGFFSVECNDFSLPDILLNLDENTKHTMQNVLALGTAPKYSEVVYNFTVVVKRTEYANLYHAMTEWYNVFLILFIFGQASNCKMTVLFIDGHPRSVLDNTWSTLFGQIVRAGVQLAKPTLYRNLVWSLSENSPLNNHKAKILPMVESFRHFVLQKHDINGTCYKNCQKLNILFIWRRDYVAHPRNPSGRIRRKIKNEIELLEKIKKWYPYYEICGVQMDKLSMRHQLSLMSKTDILIGMHGAGMSHVLFLPKGAGVIELFPKDTYPSNIHFKALARWRKLFYISWQNVQKFNDFPDDGSTYIPPNVLKHLIKKISEKVCRIENK